MSKTEEERGELDLPLPKNHADLPRFCNLVRFFTKLSSVQGKGSTQLIHDLVLGFINSWKKNIGNDIYPAVRLWFPKEDDQLSQLSRIKDTAVGKMIVSALDLPPKSAIASSIINVKRSNFTRADFNDEDGLALRAKRAIDERFPIRDFSSLRIDEVTTKLEELLNSDKAKQTEIIKYFITTLNSDEFYWLIKIIQNKLNIRCSESTFLRIFHPNADQVYLVNKSLKTVCQQLWSLSFSVSEKNKLVKPLSFFCPMLAKYVRGMSVDFNSCVELMHKQGATDGFYIEEKVDGERVQLHWVREGNGTKFFSRRSLDHTESYQSIFDEFDGCKDAGTKCMAELLADDVESIVLDGEVVAWDPVTNDFCGQSKVRELTHYVKPGQYKHMVFIFDVVYFNGEDLTDVPLKERKELLKRVFDPAKRNARYGRMDLLPYRLGKTANDISEEFKKIVAEISEGLVVKNPMSKYHLNSRTNDWVKVKPEYVDGYGGETLDLVLVGAYRGSGKFQSKFGSYLCALRDETKRGRFVALSKVGSGICIAMHDHINSIIDPIRFSSSVPPPFLDLSNQKDSVPDFYIPFEKALVVELKYSEIIPPEMIPRVKNSDSGGYGSGFSLRFPRYVKLREDKTFESATSIGEFMEIYAGRVRHNALTIESKKRATQGMSSLAKRVREDQEKKYKEATENLNVKSKIFSGNSFYLCGDIEQPEYLTESELAHIIREHGGVVKSLYQYGAYPIADRLVPKAATLKNEAIYHPCWLFDSINAGQLLAPEPMHYFMGAPLDNGLVDRYGFSLTRRQQPAEIKRIMDAMDFSNKKFTDEQLSTALGIWKTSTGKTIRALLFVGYLFYIDTASISHRRLKFISNLINYSGGNIVLNLEQASHIVSDLDITSEKPVVNSEWIENCWFDNELK